MANLQADAKPKILEYLKRLAPHSIVDRGIALASSGHVLECSKSGSKVTTVLTDPKNEEEYSVSLDIISGKKVIAQCRCSSSEEMREQWCHHAIASLWRANDLGFFDPYSGFADSEAIYRMNTTTPEEIASVIRSVNSDPALLHHELSHPTPKVTIYLVHTSDRLGLRVLFDDQIQEPNLFEAERIISARALDNILIQILEEEGSWDEDNKVWYVNSSSQISIVLGLIREYDTIVSSLSEKPILFSDTPIEACIDISWLDSGARFHIEWVLPSGEKAPKEGELFGTGPYWTVIDHTVYPISKTAARLAAIFPYASTLTLPRSQVGPILEVLQETPDGDFVHVTNPALQPTSEVATPSVILELERRDSDSAHFTSQNEVVVHAKLDFEYPSPPQEENHVYLPNREQEQETAKKLKSYGFQYLPDKRRYSLTGDNALDFLFEKASSIPPEWEVEGLKEIQSGLRFAELQFNVSLRDSSQDDKKSPSGMQWFDCHISLTQNNANIPISTLFRNARSQSDRWFRLDSGAFAKIPTGGMGQLKATLGSLDPNFRLSNTIKAQLNVAQAIGFSTYDDEQFQVSQSRKLKTLTKKLADFQSIENVRMSKNFCGELRTYQQDGLNWLSFLHQFELGGILADEMGLGKTVQTLALIQSLKSSRTADKKLKGPVLIVAPTSVITNWQYEARRFAPKLSVMLLHGPARKKHFRDIPSYDIVITSYAL
ncbi:MAG: hypothetical protein KDD55_11100, partial [Bdellovibrionales bacterium]|nr:hypothetical protein [Bdellovibrionales bacterium]